MSLQVGRLREDHSNPGAKLRSQIWTLQSRDDRRGVKSAI
jgi:hypothetical protein